MAKFFPQEFQLDSLDESERAVSVVASTTAFVYSPEQYQDENQVWHTREVYEAIVEWDLERYLKNPVILWGHQAWDVPIGTAASVEFDPTTGLQIRIKFATERANKKAEEIFQAVREGLVRATSVGFTRLAVLTEEERDGAIYRRIRAELSELSVVGVPADEDALARGTRGQLAGDGSVTIHPETDEERKEKLSAAAKALSAARKTGVKLDSTDDDFRFDAGSRLDPSKVQRTPVGGIRVTARIARAGILNYRNRDGSVRREYRPLDEVSRAESLASFEGAPVIDFTDHVKLVTPEDFRGKAVGHTSNVRMDGEYVVADLWINDADTIELIDRGERDEISAGYRAKEDRTPGSHRGQTYDLVQRKIVGNHVALCPPNRGRSGPEVGLRLDSIGGWSAMETDEMTVKIKLDGKDYEFGSEAHMAKLDELHAKELATKDQQIADLTKANTEGRAKFDAFEAETKAERKKREEDEAAAKEEAKKADEAKKAETKSRMKRALRAARIMEEDDEEKLDGLLDMSDREMMLAAIKHVDPEFAKLDETDDYIRCRFDSLEDPATRLDGIGGVVEAVQRAKQTEANSPDAARARMQARNRDAWKTPSQGAK
jgi:HK97 family phage prohead protease